MICPRFRSLIFFLETVLPRPRFLPALLTDVIPFHNEFAGTEISNVNALLLRSLTGYYRRLLKKFVVDRMGVVKITPVFD